MSVWIYRNKNKQIGDDDYLRAFESENAAHNWLAAHDPAGVASKYGPENELIAPKDLLVFAPALAGALALTWEVGSFYPIGFSAFGAFSTSEHLAFAITVLPLAFLVGMLVLVMTNMLPWQEPMPRPSGRGQVKLLALLAVGSLIILLVVPPLNPGNWSVLPYFMSAAFFIGPWIYVLVMPYGNRLYCVAGMTTWLMFLAFSTGVDHTRLNLASDRVTDIETLEGKQSLIVIRANSSAFFGYDPTSRRAKLIKGDLIKARSWNPTYDWLMPKQPGSDKTKLPAKGP